jgi:hypothetical protein
MRFLLPFLLMTTLPAVAQMVEVKDNQTQTAPAGREKAQEYFNERQSAKEEAAPRRMNNDGGAMPRYLAIHLGGFFTSKAYNWGTDGPDHQADRDDAGKFNMGVTYRMGEWVNSMDLAMRFEYTSYTLTEFDNSTLTSHDEDSRKLSFSFLMTFPDANSRFPLYFGAGIGPGFMVKKLEDESALVLDYQLVAGARFLDVIENVGFMVESGMKNHLSLLSSGQFNGVFINVGTVFAF